MLINCKPCNRNHNFSAKEMRLALVAFQNGDAQTVRSGGIVESICLDSARDAGWESESDANAVRI